MTNITATDNEALFKQLTQRPKVAWPTLFLLILAYGLFATSTAGYLLEYLSLGWTIAISSIACYISFTAGHDASHNAVSTNKRLNDWTGRLSTVLLSPIPFFRMFRYIHMQHHRFANDHELDPDHYCGRGGVTLPLRWATLDLHYFYLYLQPKTFFSRPKSEQREFIVASLMGIAFVSLIISMGWAEQYLLLFIIPTRIAVVFLAFAFDFLPHYPHQAKAKESPYQATVNRTGFEWLLTPVLLSQNYHLVHHLYPTVPFYRYISVWRAKERFHQSQEPAEVKAFALSRS